MPRPTARRHSLYLLVISSGPFVIVRGPEGFEAWPVIRKALRKVMREEHGLKAADVSSVEGLADPRDDIEPDTVARLAAAFDGADHFRRFYLYAWTGDGFALARKPLAS